MSPNVLLTSIIIKPATIAPKDIAEKLFQNPICKNTAIALPVHTPVRGRGIATNIITPNHFFKLLYFCFSALSSILSLCFLNFSSNITTNLEKNLVFFNNLKTNNATTNVEENKCETATETKVVLKEIEYDENEDYRKYGKKQFDFSDAENAIERGKFKTKITEQDMEDFFNR